MKIFNTLTKKKEELKPSGDVITIYSCGPTVYNFVHIGNLRTFMFEDLFRRWLKYRGYKLKQVKNITDVDDKIIRDSQKDGVSLKEFTDKYTKSFFEDTDALKIERAEEYPKATEHIKEMVAMIKVLLDKGIAYKAEEGIYYSIEKFANYGNFAHIDPTQLQAGASGRVLTDEYDKENVADFALWKFWDEKDGDVFWEPILELDVTSEEYEKLIEQAIKNNDGEFLELNNIKINKQARPKDNRLQDEK